jgi:hypothetical protein
LPCLAKPTEPGPGGSSRQAAVPPAVRLPASGRNSRAAARLCLVAGEVRAAAIHALLGFLMLSSSLLGGCRNAAAEPEAAEARGLEGSLYRLERGRFAPVDRPEAIGSTGLEPWTVQGRVADLVASNEAVYLGVNGYGIAEALLESPNDGALPQVRFRYHYDETIFRYRTLTTLIPEGESLLCHVYFNGLLNVVDAGALELRGISLLRFFPQNGSYQFLTPPYQKQHPEWEAVGFVPETPGSFFFEWKYSDRRRTLFAYSRFSLNDLEETEIEKLAFRQSYGFRDIKEEGPPGLAALLGEARRLLDEPGYSTAYQLRLREEHLPLVRRFEYHPPGFTRAERIRLITLPVFERREHYLLLLPQGLLLAAAEGSGRVHRFRLPSLPEDCVYCNLLLHGEYLLAGWEQTSFTDVGAAGIFVEKYSLFP